MSHSIRDVDSAWVSAVHRMNEQALPHVNSMTVDYFGRRTAADGYFRAVCSGGRPLAFLLAMDEQTDYDSLNFLWFKSRYPRFVYIDRVVVSPDHRRAGMAGALYVDLACWARGRTPLLACEVNTRPPNEASMRFHQRQGFESVGVQDTEGGEKTVSLMVKVLSP